PPSHPGPAEPSTARPAVPPPAYPGRPCRAAPAARAAGIDAQQSALGSHRPFPPTAESARIRCRAYATFWAEFILEKSGVPSVRLANWPDFTGSFGRDIDTALPVPA